MEAEEPSSGLKREIKTEDLEAEEGDAWLAASCSEEEEGEDRVKMEVEENVKMEKEGVEAGEEREEKQLEEFRSCRVVLRRCTQHEKGARYDAAAQWLLQNGSIVIQEKAGNFCQFSCSQCGETFTSQLSTRRHKKKLGGCTAQSQLTVASAHVCSICSRIVLNDSEHLYRHYTRKHKINLLTYMKEHLSQETNPEYHVVQKLKRETPIVPTHLGNYVISPCSVPRDKVTDAKENLCTFRCICSFSTSSYNSLLAHSKKCKKLTKRVTLKTAPEFVNEARYHCCRVCAKRILCDKGLIHRHVRHSHGVDAEDYAQLAGERGRHRAMEKETKIKEETIQFIDLLKKVPKVAPHKTHKIFNYKLPKSLTTEVVENLCKYKCREESCSFSASSWNTMARHMQRKHRLPSFTYHPLSLVEARYHKCRLCSKDILCDKAIIGKHSYASHQMSLEQYMSGENGKHKMPLSDSVAVKVQKGDRYKRLFVKNTIPPKFISEKVANACTFTCPHCGKKSVVVVVVVLRRSSPEP